MIIGGYKSPAVSKNTFQRAVVVYKACHFPDGYSEASKFKVFFKILRSLPISNK